MKNLLAIIFGRRISQRTIDRVSIKGRYQGILHIYEEWGQSIAKKSLIRELTGTGTVRLYNLQGDYIGKTD